MSGTLLEALRLQQRAARSGRLAAALACASLLALLAGCEAAPASTVATDSASPSDVQTGGDAAASTDTQSQPDAQAGTDAGSQTDAQADTDVAATTDAGAQTDAQTGTDAASGPCAGKADGSACDDGDPCTQTACDAGVCKVLKDSCSCASNADCPDDANLCNGKPYCDLAAAKPVCKINPASVVTCKAPASGCEEALCSPSTGSCVVVAKPNNTACDDGQACTVGDVCTAGKCVAGTDTCPCTQDADCAKKEDGNLCNGTLFCNKSNGQCQINPASVVSCPTADDTTCSQNTCDPKTGDCLAKLASNGAACDDGNPCTANETCQKGSCVATANTCICTQDADCADEEDGNFCNGTLYCDIVSGSCKVNPATVVNCPDSFNDCAPNVCEPTTGKCGAKTLPANTPCDDGDPCTAVGVCAAGQCKNGINTCECVTDTDCDKFDDGDLCNGTLFCNKVSNSCEVNQATIKSCPSVNDTACSKNLCQPASGTCAITALPPGTLCDDGQPCTGDGGCQNGTCSTGLPKACDDLNACTVDSCNPLTGQCVNNPAGTDGQGCEADGSKCTPSDVCVAGICKQGAAISCDDGNSCTADACDPLKGCSNTAIAGSCDDGDPCTGADACAESMCKGQPKVCDDANVCTNDVCDPTSGECVGKPNTASCDDGKACTSGDACVGGACIAAVTDCPCTTQQECLDGNPCTQDSCDPGTGKCKYTATVCDDSNPCTTDSCDPANKDGCVFTAQDGPAPGATACSPDVCSVGTFVCEAGQLVCAWKGAAAGTDGVPCSDAGGICKQGDCFLNAEPEIPVGIFDGGQYFKPGPTLTLVVSVVDANTDNTKGINDIVKIEVDVGAPAGAPQPIVLTVSSAGTANNERLFSVQVPTAGLATGAWAIPIVVTDASGGTRGGYVPLYIYTGSVRTVGSGKEFSNLKAAVADAASGDLLLVSPGTYQGVGNKNLLPGSKELVVLGEAGADKTVIELANSGKLVTVKNTGGTARFGLGGVTVQNAAAGGLTIATESNDFAYVGIVDCVFKNNSNGGVGGGIQAIGSKINLLVARTDFQNNGNSSYEGGHLYVQASEPLRLWGVVFRESNGSNGRIARILGGVVEIHSVQFLGTVGDYYGFLCSALVTDLRWLRTQNTSGSVLRIEAGAVVMTDAQFEQSYGNYLVSLTNVDQVQLSKVRLSKCSSGITITGQGDKSVEGLFASSSSGSVLSLSGGNNKAVTLSNSVFLGNQQAQIAVSYGQVSNCRFEGNNTQLGSAGPALSLSSGKIENTTFVGNGNVSSAGGGLNASYGATVRDCTFISNVAKDGAGLVTTGNGYPSSSGTTTVANCIFVGNQAADRGGAVIVQTSSAAPTFRGITFVENKAQKGGAIAVVDSTAEVRSSILWGNVATDAGAQVFVTNTAVTSLQVANTNLWQDYDAAIEDVKDDGLKINGGEGYAPGVNGNISKNPLFVSGPGGSYYLSQKAAGQAVDSPCVNPAGSPLVSDPDNAIFVQKTTRSDQSVDSGVLDMGYHYPVK